MKPLLRPLSFLYSQVVAVKNSIYNQELFFQYQAPCQVISIGNLTMGGTGKTPLTDACVKYFINKNKSVAVISRSYRAQAFKPVQVDVTLTGATAFFGDEPVQLALANPQADFYVGPTKWQTARLAVAHKDYDILLVDDGFQHRHLKRNFDLVVLDATEDLRNYQTVPEGRAREPWSSLARASLIAITKCNWASSDQVHSLKVLLPPGKPVVFFDFLHTQIKKVFSGDVITLSEIKGQSVFLVSAIGRPEVFEQQMGEFFKVVGSLKFRDHHPYSEADARQILSEFTKSGAQWLLTTEKDAVKLKTFMPSDINFVVAPLSVQETGSQGALDEILSQFI